MLFDTHRKFGLSSDRLANSETSEKILEILRGLRKS